MKITHKKSLTVVAASALASGISHGAIVYNYYNQTIVAGGADNFSFDLNDDGSNDFLIEFDNNNALKPYINDSPGVSGATLSYVLSDATGLGLPLATNGTVINGSYESDQTEGWFWEDANSNIQGGWNSGGTNIDSYVGLTLTDAGGTNHFGWAHFIYNSQTVEQGVTGILTLVDTGMETGTAGITAGQTAEPGLPSIYRQPLSQTNYAGGSAQLQVVALGNPNPTYQWMAGTIGSGVYTNLTDNSDILGSATSTLTISNLTAGDSEDYVVVVSNANGSVTSPVPATVTVVPSIIYGVTPDPVELYSGSAAHITVNFAASVSDQFIWQKNGAPLSGGGNISGVDTPTLVISPVSSADVASYSVIVTNVYGAITSSVDPLIVLTATSPYQQAVAALQPVCYYSFDENSDPASGNAIAFDYVGGLNGLYGDEIENGNSKYDIAGPRPSDGFAGFSASNSAILIGPNAHDTNSWVTIPPPDFDANTVTFVTWIYPTELEPNWSVMLSYRSPVSGTANELNITGSGNGDLGYHWNDNGSSYNYASGLIPPADQWSFVAVAVSSTNTVFYLFNVDQAQTATNIFAAPDQIFNNPGHIGGDSIDGNFVGEMDELAVFNQTLSSNEVSQLYNAAVGGTAPPPPVTLNIAPSGSSLVLTWSQGTLLQASAVAGPWSTNTATSPYTISTSGAQQFYKVLVQ